MKSEVGKIENLTSRSTSYSEDLSPHLDSVRANIEAAKSENTRRAYSSDWRNFETWCSIADVLPLPATPSTIATYASWMADSGRKVSTLERALVAISQAHQLKGFETPTADARVRETVKGIRRRYAYIRRRAKPLFPEHLRTAYPKMRPGPRAIRNRSMLNLGLAGGFRRSELVDLDFADLEFVEEGVIVTLRRSKTDQEGQGFRKGIPFGQYPETCPVKALRAWLNAAEISEGPIYRTVTNAGVVLDQRTSTQAVNRAVKAVAKLAGLEVREYSAHSLRAGLVTTASRAGKRLDRIMDMSGHTSEKVVRGYIREGSLFRDNAASGIGL